MELTNPKTSLSTAAGRFQWLIAFLVFSLPLGQMALTNVFLLLLFIQSLTAYRWNDWKLGLKDPMWWTQAGFYLFLVLSLSWATDTANGGRQLETKFSLFLAPLFLLSGKNLWLKSSRAFALKALILGSLLAIGIALVYAGFRSWEAGAFFEESPFGRRYFFAYTHLATPLMHPGYLATYMAIALFGAIELHQAERSRKWQWLYRLVGVLFIVFMVMLQARINLIALFMVIVLAALYIAWQRRAFWWLSLPLIPVIALGLFLAIASPELKDRYFQVPNFEYDIEGDDFNSATYRLAEWKCAWDVIEAHPWLGTGLGDNQRALFDSYERNRFWEGLAKKYNAHNQYLETMIAGGVVALGFLILALFYALYRAFKQEDYLATATLIFLMISMLTESVFERMWGILIFTILIPFLLQKRPKESGSNAD